MGIDCVYIGLDCGSFIFSILKKHPFKKSDENQIGFRRFFLESTYTGVDNTGAWA